MRALSLLAALALTLLGTAAADRTPVGPPPPAPCPAPRVDMAKWRTIRAIGVGLRLPARFKQGRAVGTDSWVARYEADGGSSIVSIDYGRFSDDLHADPERFSVYGRCRETIGAQPATVVTALTADMGHPPPHYHPHAGHYVAAATWRDVAPGFHLTIYTETPSLSASQELLAALRTVRFR